MLQQDAKQPGAIQKLEQAQTPPALRSVFIFILVASKKWCSNKLCGGIKYGCTVILASHLSL